MNNYVLYQVCRKIWQQFPLPYIMLEISFNQELSTSSFNVEQPSAKK